MSDTFNWESFLKEEERAGYLVPASMKEVWAVHLELVQELLRVCNEHSLRIWADGGTLLGAVRHHGYIPWDDDIDMIMLREDYDKLVSISSECFSSPYFFQTAYSESAPYPRAHAQLRKDGTAAVLLGDVDKKFHQGIFIDIFPLDEVPESDDMLSAKLRRMDKYKNLAEICYKPVRAGRFKPTVHRLLRKIYSMIFPFLHIFRKWENAIKECIGTPSPLVCNLSLFTTIDVVHRKTLKKEWYKDTIMLPFEFIMLPAPKAYVEVLTTLYGDYMTPIKGPSYHGSFYALDAHKSYESILNGYGK